VKAGWVIENRDSDDRIVVVVDRPMVIDPPGGHAPRVAVGLSFAVHNFSTKLAGQGHILGDANAKGPLLGVAKDDRLFRRQQRDVEIDDSLSIGHVESQPASIRALLLSVGPEPIIEGFDHRLVRAAPQRHELFVFDRP